MARILKYLWYFAVILILGRTRPSTSTCLTEKFTRSTRIAWKVSENVWEGCDKLFFSVSGDGDVTLYHELQFQSAYTPPPTYTNYTLDFKGCLDYIFVDETLKLVKSIPLYENQELEEHEGCPNQVFPSDHFALVADVEFLR